jgi:hypothetical protein
MATKKTSRQAGKKVLAFADFTTSLIDELEIPELGGVVYLRDPSAAEVLEFNRQVSEVEADDQEGQERAVQFLISCSLCTADGERLAKTPGEVKQLTQMPVMVWKRLAEAVVEKIGGSLSGTGGNDSGGD